MTRKEEIDKKGYIIIKNVFSPEEIAEIRDNVINEKDHKGDLLSSKLLSKVITDSRILTIFKECLGQDEIFYFGDSSFSFNAGGTKFHKDSKDREKKDSQEFKDKNYSLLRLGIYLQDHSQHSKGLSLRADSHLEHSVKKGKIINFKSEIGDIVIWKLTTTHAGNTEIVSFLPNVAFNPNVAKRFPEFIKLKSIEPRIAIFMCFGLEDDYSKAYIEYLKTRKYAIERWQISTYSDEAIKAMTDKNVKLYDSFDINDIDLSTVSKRYKQV